MAPCINQNTIYEHKWTYLSDRPASKDRKSISFNELINRLEIQKQPLKETSHICEID